jgi:hypothetical protein
VSRTPMRMSQSRGENVGHLSRAIANRWLPGSTDSGASREQFERHSAPPGDLIRPARAFWRRHREQTIARQRKAN